jgi:hypothetical protein
VLNRRGGVDHYTNRVWGSQWKWTSPKETGINCREVSRDKFPLTSGIRLVNLSAGIVDASLGHQ